MKTLSVRTRIKVCGFTRAGDVRLACELGVDAIGFSFSADSPRRVRIEEARALRQAVAPLVSVVASFKDNTAEEVRDVVRALRPGALQFCGNEDDAFCRMAGLPYIKTIPFESDGKPVDMRAMHAAWPQAAAFLFEAEDAPVNTAMDWARLPADNTKPIMVGQGVSLENVTALINTRAPWALDVCEVVESSPGMKDPVRLRAFLEAVHHADCANEHESGLRLPTDCG